MTSQKNNHPNNETFFQYKVTPGLGELHCKFDPQTGLRAIIAIHSVRHGGGLGGCRFIEYPSNAEALYDVKRLAQAMSYKSALCGLPYGGAKAVIIKSPETQNRADLFRAFGRFVDSLQGRYITTVDSGTRLADLADIASQTSFVTAHQARTGYDPDPSPHTALGVYRGIEAALNFHLQKNLSDAHIAIQGLGNVGHHLAALLHQAGARLTVTDANPALVQPVVSKFKATAVAADEIYRVPCDVFSPCALGAIINPTTIPQLQTTIVAGCANNQLASPDDGIALHQRGILYAPDYIINAGGLIFVSIKHHGDQDRNAEQTIKGIYNTLFDIFQQAREKGQAVNLIADEIAQARVHKDYLC